MQRHTFFVAKVLAVVGLLCLSPKSFAQALDAAATPPNQGPQSQEGTASTGEDQNTDDDDAAQRAAIETLQAQVKALQDAEDQRALQ